MVRHFFKGQDELFALSVELPADRDLVATQMMGLMMARYEVRLEPLASADPEEVVQLVAPNVQRYLMGDLSQGRLLDQCGS